MEWISALIACHVEVSAECQLGAVGGIEVREDSVGAGDGPGPVDRPGAVCGEEGCTWREFAGVVSDDDEVELLLVQEVEIDDGLVGQLLSRIRKVKVPGSQANRVRSIW